MMRLLDHMLQRFVKIGTLRIVDASGTLHEYAATPEPRVTIKLKDPRLHRSLFLNPELRAGEAYMDQTLLLEEGTLRDFLLLYVLNRENLRSQPVQQVFRAIYRQLRYLHQYNPIARARKNISHHYDLSNDLYQMFLDKDLNYSCAYFLSPADTLEIAQLNKLHLVATKLLLKPGQNVLDIGSGWGALAIYLAKEYNVNVTGVTLSREQYSFAMQRAVDCGVADRVKFELKDYREVTGKFDRIVSVAMFEAVGVGHYREFFSKISSLLADHGVALLHSIGRMDGPGFTSPWIRKYIFPGGYFPALSETLAAVEKSRLWVTDIEILRIHYAETLRAWERRFQNNRKKVAELLGEHFCRMWELYLITSEFSFRYGRHMVFQIQFTKKVDAAPLVRSYLTETDSHWPSSHFISEPPRAAEVVE
jgi:cyclopropane-fatty-acyl-phospholipid synthase